MEKRCHSWNEDQEWRNHWAMQGRKKNRMGRRRKIQPSILFLVIKSSRSLFSPVLILCHPEGVSWARVPGRRAGCHFAADRCFILCFNFSAALRLCEHGYLTVQVRPAFSCLSPKHIVKLRRWEISYELCIQICNSINLVKCHCIHTSYISWDWNLIF